MVRDPELMARVRMAFDLYEAAEAMMRQNLRRRFPGESEEQIEQRVLAWLRDRPGAEHGDAGGPVRVRRVFD
jgi:Rv0078B-related antitoxin